MKRGIGLSFGPGAALQAATAAGALMVSLAVGCSHDEAQKERKTMSLGARPGLPTPPPAAPTADETTTEPGTGAASSQPSPHVVIATAADAAPLTLLVKVKPDGQAPAEDPDVAVVEAARRAASACFTNITDGSSSRTASITVTVIPSGSVTRVDVSAPSTQEPWILSCLEGVGNGLRFSDKPKADIRTFSIGASASRAH
jgi:hypothetical protein